MFRVADLYCLLSSPNTTGVVKSGSMRWKGRYVASMRDNRMHTKVLVENYAWEGPLKRLGVLGFTIFQRTLNRQHWWKRNGLSSCYCSS